MDMRRTAAQEREGEAVFGWFKTKQSNSPAAGDKPLYLKDGAAAVEFAGTFLKTDLYAGSTLPAVVIDAAAIVGQGSAVRTGPDGMQTATLRVASKDGGFIVLASTASSKGPALRVGDLVAWHAGQQVPELAGIFPDPRSTWVGLIVAKLRPEYSNGKGWAVEQPFSA